MKYLLFITAFLPNYLFGQAFEYKFADSVAYEISEAIEYKIQNMNKTYYKDFLFYLIIDNIDAYSNVHIGFSWCKDCCYERLIKHTNRYFLTKSGKKIPVLFRQDFDCIPNPKKNCQADKEKLSRYLIYLDEKKEKVVKVIITQ